jgi:hypothetical protein
MLPRRAAARSARLSAVVAGADLRRVGRADRVVAVMRGCPNHPTVFTMHPSGICAICRAAADAGPTAIAPPYSIPAGCQEVGEYAAKYVRPIIWADGGTLAQYGFPKSSGIPSTARAILDMVPERKVAPPKPADPRAEGIARAVANLSHSEKRLGASRFQP